MSLSIQELLDGIRDQLTNDPLVAAAVSSVISPEGRALLAGVVGSLADLEAKHEAEKAAAAQVAHDDGYQKGVADTVAQVPGVS